jgi:proteasome accessory factor C
VTPARQTSGTRLQRLLALVPWVAAHDGPHIDEVCKRFAITPAELATDLEVVFLVGLYPFTPDQLIEATIEDDRVWIRYAEMFARPLRLQPEEALTLVAAGQGLLAVPGSDPDGPLARGLAKLAEVLGIDTTELLDIDLGDTDEGIFDLLRDAVSSRTSVELDYYSFGRDERSRRVVDPWHVVADQGQWYLQGWCHQAGGARSFRVDRIADAKLLTDRDEPFVDPPDDAPGVRFRPDDDQPRVTLALDPSARWVAESYPVDDREEQPDGGLVVSLPVSGQAWLERLLLRLGPTARVLAIDPALGDLDIASRVAGRLLERYRST